MKTKLSLPEIFKERQDECSLQGLKIILYNNYKYEVIGQTNEDDSEEKPNLILKV